MISTKVVEIHYIEDVFQRTRYVNNIIEAWDNIRTAKNKLNDTQNEIGNLFGVEREDPIYRFNANKLPK